MPACAGARLEPLEPRIALAVFTVGNANDTGAGSLRQAILSANSSTLADEIQFDAAFFSTPQTISLLSALPQFSGAAPLTITGPGSQLLTVRRSTTITPQFGVFSSAAPAITMSGMTITGGNANGNGGGIGLTGNPGARATFDDLVVTGNTTTGDGGGISLNNNATLMLRNSVVTDNTARQGGGIHFFNGGALVVENCRIGGNTSTITTGVGGGGGGVYFFGAALVNPPAGFTPETLVLRNSTVEGNNAARNGGGIYVEGFDGTLLIQNSTISGNTTAIAGGGVCATIGGDGLLLFANATVSGNTAGTAGGGIAIPEGAYSATLQSTTVTGNTANGTAAAQGGGGIARTSLIPGTVTMVNSVASGNNNPGGSAPDIRANAQTTNRVNFSAVGSSAGFTLAAGSGNNRPFGENLMVGALADNGGPTRTHLPAASSPLVNNGSNTNAAQFTTDQRGTGYPRVSGPAVDIGAVERDAVAPAVSQASFTFATSHLLLYQFSEDVRASLGPSDVVLTNLTTGTNVPTSHIALTYDTHNFAYILFPGYPNGALPDGNYRASIVASGVTDASGNPLPANHVYDFYVLAGDANRDRRVDFSDLAILAQNYNTTLKSFTGGNFNYDPAGKVDFDDLALLAQRYNTSLPAPAGAAENVVSVPVFAVGARPIAPRRLVRRDVQKVF
jgi:parallel beta-helix repeat protein